MNEDFEAQKNQQITEYESKIASIEEQKNKAFETMQMEMQAKIDELKRLLDKERENSAGSAKELRDKLQAEIEDLKKQLAERTGQLESASISILERNEEITTLKQELEGHLQYISELESKIKDLEQIIQNS